MVHTPTITTRLCLCRCVIKAYRGNVEAQFTHTSSAQLLYRRERYFNTRDVRLKDLYPMIEWYKSRRHLFLVVAEGSTASSNEGGLSVAFTAVRDVREDMLVNIRGTIEERKGTEDDSVHRGAATDHDGVHLCEVVIKDATGASLLLNLWDQHADPKFVTRFLAHRGPVEAKGVIISFNSATNSLVGDTTPRTEFRFTNAGTADGSPCGSEGSDDADLRNHVFTSIEAIENTSLAGHLHIENVVIDSVLFSDFMGKAGAVTPAYTPLLTECFCSICDCKLPVTHVDSIHRTYGSCPQQCRPKHGESERKWRYRSVTMVLRDTSGSKLSVLVEDTVMTRLLGNIQAESLVNPKTSSGTASLPFNPQTTVAGLVNALVQGTNSGLAMRVELKRVLRKASDTSTGSLNDSVRSDVSGRGEHVEYLAVQMAPIVDTIW